MPDHIERSPRVREFQVASLVLSERRTRGVCPQTVDQYRRLLEGGRTFPPLRLVRCPGGYAVRDGRHRLLAARVAGEAFVACEVVG